MTEDLILVAMTASDLAEISVNRTPGATKCKWANELHYDLLVADTAQMLRLAETLLGAGRKTKRFARKAMGEARDATNEDGCHAANPKSVNCKCEDEIPASKVRSWLGWLLHKLGRAIRTA
ncbi:MAG: hypothetical protein ACYC35_20290 [Pirellulales bacterium]